MMETLDGVLSPSSAYNNPAQDPARILFELETNKSVFFTKLTVKVYPNRISLEYRPYIGSGESRETYSAMDIGDIYIKKGRKRGSVGAHRVDGKDILFEIKNLLNSEAEELKDALDLMLSYRYLYRR